MTVKEVCPKCEIPLTWNKVEIEIGDINRTVADAQFNYCEKCGYHSYIDWFD